MERVLKGWREQEAASGAAALIAGDGAFQGTPGDERRLGHGHMHYEEDLEADASKGEGNTGSGPGRRGQVTTATPLLHQERARRALGSLKWIPVLTRGQQGMSTTDSKAATLRVAAHASRHGLERGLFCDTGFERDCRRG